MLDSGMSCVRLPVPQKHYTISKTLLIHSNQELRLDRFSKIRLADNSNCAMLRNSDPENGNENICISGGIWDMNNKNQRSNPFHYKNPEGRINKLYLDNVECGDDEMFSGKKC